MPRVDVGLVGEVQRHGVVQLHHRERAVPGRRCQAEHLGVEGRRGALVAAGDDRVVQLDGHRGCLRSDARGALRAEHGPPARAMLPPAAGPIGRAAGGVTCMCLAGGRFRLRRRDPHVDPRHVRRAAGQRRRRGRRPDRAAVRCDTGHRSCRPSSRRPRRSQLEELSRYDDRGPAWYWNNFRTGEHTGTHFDAPNHWVTGRDGEDVASVPVRPAGRAGRRPRLLRPGRREPGLPARGRRTSASGRPTHGAAARRRLAAATAPAGTPGPPRQEQFLNADDTGPHTPGHVARSARGGSPRSRRSSGWAWRRSAPTRVPRTPSTRPSLATPTSWAAASTALTQLQNLGVLPPTGRRLVVSAPLPIVGGSGSPVRGCWPWSTPVIRRGAVGATLVGSWCRRRCSVWSARQLRASPTRWCAAGAPFVAARHEGGATTMADAYARMSDRPRRSDAAPGLRAHQRADRHHRGGQEPDAAAGAGRRGDHLRGPNFHVDQDGARLGRRGGARTGHVTGGRRAPTAAAAVADRRATSGGSSLLNLPLDVQALDAGDGAADRSRRRPVRDARPTR